MCRNRDQAPTFYVKGSFLGPWNVSTTPHATIRPGINIWAPILLRRKFENVSTSMNGTSGIGYQRLQPLISLGADPLKKRVRTMEN
jgi:hypothetical protein